ncbi:tautomerase family protein [Algisphaera agarilytica]|uniref:Tautomerase n=1 Tax=Algisphaera agarilytica TaxID=1385975 RepID=A0A7X0H411_9BACT|nr:4-oxalocrotonate tautomerase family protein [Algisphaera agarilytica]MBB6428662.1 4-oxalocrotonate tautomerase [Algisphaera agarilytica]
MPYINVKVTRDGVTAEHKAEIVRRFTDTLVDVLGKKPEHIHIVLDLVDEEDWGFAGMLTTEYRKTRE